jgi:hypothetical protein
LPTSLPDGSPTPVCWYLAATLHRTRRVLWEVAHVARGDKHSTAAGGRAPWAGELCVVWWRECSAQQQMQQVAEHSVLVHFQMQKAPET